LTGRVFTKLLFSFLLVLSIGTGVLDFTLRRIVEHSLRDQVAQSLAGKAALVAVHLEGSPHIQPQAFVQSESLAAAADVTLFGSDGRPVASSRAPSQVYSGPELGAVLHRPAAYAQWVDNDRLYVAIPAAHSVVQLSHSLGGVRATMHVLRRDLLVASAVAFLLAMLLAAFLAQRAAHRMSRIVTFANQIAAGDLTARMDEGDLDEISEVAHALDATASRLERSFKALESQQRELAALINSMQEAVVAVDANGLVSWSNTVMQRISPGAVREGRALVQTVRDPEVLACVSEALHDRQIRSGKAKSVVPGRIFEVNAAPTPDGGAVAVLHDVTEIERAETTRRDFVANVSHELRTPLTSISGYVETLLDTTAELPDHVREFLGIILKNANRMNRLTEDLLALANVESGQYKLQLQALPAAALVNDAIDALAGMMVDSGVELAPGDITDTPVDVDMDALTQVFGNLIENAMKYARSGQRVLVGARDVAAGVEFYVQDFGPGIAFEHQGRIFERFYRIDKARSRESGGTGLGLAIAKHIVIAHGGSIRVESELGAGATFLFQLPSAPGAESAAAEPLDEPALHDSVPGPATSKS
jgi:two-component system, OmpR family, phosphate regulon sensor histidine kinase PhoR